MEIGPHQGFQRIFWIVWRVNLIHWFQNITLNLLNKKFPSFLSNFLGDSNTSISQFEKNYIKGQIILTILFEPTLRDNGKLDLANLDIINSKSTTVRWKEPNLGLRWQ